VFVFVVEVPLGVGSACTARVGQCLGALQPQSARFTCKVALAIQGKFSYHPIYADSDDLCENVLLISVVSAELYFR